MTRFPLAAKITVWFFVNLLLLAAVAFVVMRGQFRFGLDALISGRAGERVQAAADLFTGELRTTPRRDWPEVAERYRAAYHVDFFLVRSDGAKVAGPEGLLPPAVGERIADRTGAVGRGRPFEPQAGPGRPPFRNSPFDENQRGPDGAPRSREGGPRPGEPGARPGGNEPRPEEGSARGTNFTPRSPENYSRQSDGGPRPPDGSFRRSDGAMQGPPMPGQTGPSQKFMLHAGDRYWVGVRLPVQDRDSPRPAPLLLLIASDSLSGGGLFLDFMPFVWGGAAAVVLSVLLWLPFVRGVTRSVAQLTGATERIAEGRFDARVSDRRNDELGALAAAVNRMALRLDGFVGGQKRFLGDIAHELCAPIARLQLSLGILEQRTDAKSREAVADLREELDHMSGLVNELLSFSKASLGGNAVKVQAVNVREVAEKAAHRERHEGSAVRVEIAGDLRVLADPELLLRALGNLLRNSIRYAGTAGPITVSAAPRDDAVEITVADGGPGVPAGALSKLFDPFYRVDESRTRDTGGVGLGLTIVKTCIESCGGSVSCRNREPSGLEVTLRLRGAAGSAE